MMVKVAGGLMLELGSQEGELQLRATRSLDVPQTRCVESRRNDGTLWRRHWDDEQKLVIDFVGVALAEVTADTITFDRQLSNQVTEHLVLDHALPLWLAWRGALVVHAGLVVCRGAGVALIGRSGAGKSTLTTHLGTNGWLVGGDDGIVIEPSSPPTAEATYASIRLTDNSVDLLDVDDHTPIAGKHRLGLGSFDVLEEPVDLAVLAFVEPADTTAIERLGPAATHAALFGSTFHADLDPDRTLPRVFEELAHVVEATIAVTLRVGRGIDGLDAARDALEELLDQRQ